MSALILRTPAHNPGLSVLHNSRVLAAYSPLVFEWTRRDYDIDSVSENAGRSNQLDVVIAGVDLTTEITDGAQIWVEATGFYSGLATVVSTSFSTDTTIATDVLKNAAAVAESDFINLIDDRPDYRLLCDFIGVAGDGTSEGSITTAAITPGPGPKFRMSIDAGPFVRPELNTVAVPDYEEGTTFYQQLDERGQLFYVSYSELWTGATPTADQTLTFTALPAFKGARDRYGENAIDLEVWENSLGDDYKPQLVTALPDPVYFPGWPFFAAFAYQDTDEPTWSLKQRNTRAVLTPATTNTRTIIPPGGFHLVSAVDPGHDDLQGLEMWIETDLFFSFFFLADPAIYGSFAPIINMGGTAPNWVFEDGGEALSSYFPTPASYFGTLDGTVQEVKVTGIGADEVLSFVCVAANNIWGVLSFAPCNMLTVINIANQAQMTELVGPNSAGDRVDSLQLDSNSGLTVLNLSNTLLEGDFIVTNNVNLTTIALPVDTGCRLSEFTISGCTSFTQQLDLAATIPNAIDVNSMAVDFTGNGWSATLVDWYLNKLDQICGFGYTGRTIDTSGNTAPTAASLGARVSLASKGVTVTTD